MSHPNNMHTHSVLPLPPEVRMANAMESYAYGNFYHGLTTSKELFVGWPIGELAIAALGPMTSPSDRLKAMVEFKKRRTNQMMAPPAPNFPSASTSVGPSFEEMLSMRMRWMPGQYGMGFFHVAAQRVGDSVHLWVISKGSQSIIFEDEYAMFPSDALITKLNLLKEE